MSPGQGTEQADRRSADGVREQMLAGLPIVERRLSLADLARIVVPTA